MLTEVLLLAVVIDHLAQLDQALRLQPLHVPAGANEETRAQL